MLRIFKGALVFSCILIGWNCNTLNDTTGPGIEDPSSPATASELDTLLLTSHSEQNPSLLAMAAAPLPTSQEDNLNGSWEEITDSLGLKTVFKGAATVPGDLIIIKSEVPVLYDCYASEGRVTIKPMVSEPAKYIEIFSTPFIRSNFLKICLS